MDSTKLTLNTVKKPEEGISARFGHALRLIDDPAHEKWLYSHERASGKMVLLVVFAIGLMYLLAKLIPNIWYRMTLSNLILCAVILPSLAMDWRQLLTPRVKYLVIGGIAAVVLYLLAWIGFLFLAGLFPSLKAQLAVLYVWRDGLSPVIAIPLLVIVIVPGEEIIWRGGITLPLAGRLGAWVGCLAGALIFSAAYITIGSILLAITGFVTGCVWSVLLIKTRSLVPSIICHLLWDLIVLFWLPY